MANYLTQCIFNPFVLFYTTKRAFAKLFIYMVSIGTPIMFVVNGVDLSLKLLAFSIVCFLILISYVIVLYFAHWLTLKTIQQKEAFYLLSNKEKRALIGEILD